MALLDDIAFGLLKEEMAAKKFGHTAVVTEQWKLFATAYNCDDLTHISVIQATPPVPAPALLKQFSSDVFEYIATRLKGETQVGLEKELAGLRISVDATNQKVDMLVSGEWPFADETKKKVGVIILNSTVIIGSCFVISDSVVATTIHNFGSPKKVPSGYFPSDAAAEKAVIKEMARGVYEIWIANTGYQLLAATLKAVAELDLAYFKFAPLTFANFFTFPPSPIKETMSVYLVATFSSSVSTELLQDPTTMLAKVKSSLRAITNGKIIQVDGRVLTADYQAFKGASGGSVVVCATGHLCGMHLASVHESEMPARPSVRSASEASSEKGHVCSILSWAEIASRMP
jgi:hypothetical protein